eukprot:354857-Chlamydomonas_euryale.AAC.27
MLPGLNRHQVLREVRVHARLSHPHIVQLYVALQEDDTLVLVQEECTGGDLYRYMHSVGWRVSERRAVDMVVAPLLMAMRYLHSMGIVHRDIKLENVLITANGTVKLGDLGLAIDLNEERAVTRAGTVDYMAPEVHMCPLKSRPDENKAATFLHYGPGADIWAMGVLAYELVAGAQPFGSLSKEKDAIDVLMATKLSFPEYLSAAAREFISSALKKHPGDRPSAEEMLHSHWLAMHARTASLQIPHLLRDSSTATSPSTPVRGADGAPAMHESKMHDRSYSAPQMVEVLSVEQIDALVEALQAAKQHAIERQQQQQREY